MYLFKPAFYDEFKCIADKCSYTCCQEWDINVDNETFDYYQKTGRRFICDSVTKKRGKRAFAFDANNKCNFLDENGLCSLVIKYGDQAIPRICRNFPRFYTKRNQWFEHSLSNGCPAVLAHLMNTPAPLEFKLDDVFERPQSIKYVDASFDQPFFHPAIDIIQLENRPLWIKLFTLYKLLSKNSEGKIEAQRLLISEVVEAYLDKLSSFTNCNYQYKIDSCTLLYNSINSEFMNFDSYKTFLAPYDYLTSSGKSELTLDSFIEYTTYMSQYADFFENLMVNEAFAQLKDTQLIDDSSLILCIEYIVINFSLYMIWLGNGKKIDTYHMFNTISYYARNISHNRQNMLEYLSELRKTDWFGDGWLINALWS